MPPVVTTTSITHSSYNIQYGDILVPATPGPPGKWPLNGEGERSFWTVYANQLMFYQLTIYSKIKSASFPRHRAQWSNCGGTRGNGVPLPFMAGDAVPLAYTIDSYLQHKQQKKMCVKCMI